jgi:signal transduction histidine kinase
VKGTSLTVLALESEATSIAPIRTRLNVQLAFLLLLQVVTLGAFSLFLRRTWTAFVDVEARIAEQEKLAALGTAASLIAHEVKNSLNGLKGAASLLQSGGDAALVSRTMKGQVERLGHLASSLLSFSRQSETRLVEMDLNAVTRETIDGLTSLPEFAEAALELTLDGALTLSSDPLLLMAAIDNLVRNAIEAAVGAKDLGRITAPTVRVSSRREGEQYVVAVEDNAGGPTRDFEQHLGEPFFTTKSRGIGLGLAMARRAVEQLGGSLEFARVEGGSRFEIRLPAGGR